MNKGNQLETIKENLTDEVKKFVLTNKDKDKKLNAFLKAILKEYNGIFINLSRKIKHGFGKKETDGEKDDIMYIIYEIVEKEFVNYFKENAVKVEFEFEEKKIYKLINEEKIYLGELNTNLGELNEFYKADDEKVTYLGKLEKCDIEYTNAIPVNKSTSVRKYTFSKIEVYIDPLAENKPVLYELKPNI